MKITRFTGRGGVPRGPASGSHPVGRNLSCNLHHQLVLNPHTNFAHPISDRVTDTVICIGPCGRNGSVGQAGPGRFTAVEELKVGRAVTRTYKSFSHLLMFTGVTVRYGFKLLGVPWTRALHRNATPLVRRAVGCGSDAMVVRGRRWTGTAGGPVAGRHGRPERHCSAR